MKKILATTLFAAILLSCSLSVNAAGIKDIFSANYYADSYEDLYAAFEYDEAKLLKHVKEYGLKEGRDVSPILDVVFYRETYPDLDAAFGDNWDAYVKHYFEYGIKEGRDNGTNFDIIRYVNSYADLREAFDEDYEALAKHYIKYGMKENRTLGLKPQVAPAKTTVQPIVYYEEVIYDDEGRVEKVEVYSDSAKTNLVSYTLYFYETIVTGWGETRDYIYLATYDVQGRCTENVQYLNGVLNSRTVYLEFDEDGNSIKHISYSYDDEGRLSCESVIVNYNFVKCTYYHPNGNVRQIVDYVNNRAVNEISYYESGQLECHRTFDSTGSVLTDYRYYENGNNKYDYVKTEYGYNSNEYYDNGIKKYHYEDKGNGSYYVYEWYDSGIKKYQYKDMGNGYYYLTSWYENEQMSRDTIEDENGYYSKQWHENGVLKSLSEDDGITWHYKEWDEEGNLVRNESGLM